MICTGTVAVARLDPEAFRVWIRVARDVFLLVASIAIIGVQLYRNFQTGEAPNVTWLAFAAFLLGLVPAFRLDEWLFKGNGNGKSGGST